jgi:hypothetical protein
MAHLFAALARPLIPLLEAGPRSVYGVEGATVIALRWLPDPPRRRMAVVKQELWVGRANYSLALAAALILATPGWSAAERARRLGLALGLLALAEWAFFLVTVEHTQAHPVPTQQGAVLPPGFSPARQVLWGTLYAFFQVMGRGLFPLLIYLGLVAFAWSPPGEGEASGARQD